MSAKEMFEKLGYKRNVEDNKITYLQKFGYETFEIMFDLSKKEINIDTDMEVKIEEDILQAIDKQAEELGWLEEEKQETNFEHFKDEIIENFGFCFALADGKLCKCSDISCSECGFSTGHGCTEKIKEWLKKPHEKPVSVYKLTKFEKELLECYSGVYSFKVFNSLNGMKKKGYFKGIDDNELIGGILAKCEVVG